MNARPLMQPRMYFELDVGLNQMGSCHERIYTQIRFTRIRAGGISRHCHVCVNGSHLVCR